MCAGELPSTGRGGCERAFKGLVLYEFPMQELDIFLPSWVDALPGDHPLKDGLYEAIRQSTTELRHIREISSAVKQLGEDENIQ